MSNFLGEMWGENAVQAECAFVACPSREVHGIQRTMIGGVVLDGFVGGQVWERWQGTVILIPRTIDVSRGKNGMTVGQMMTDRLGFDLTDEEIKNSSFWKRKWKADAS